MVPNHSSVSPSQLGSGGSRGWTMMTIELGYGSGVMKGMETQDVDLGCNDDSVK
jgi:hypothetical protein